MLPVLALLGLGAGLSALLAWKRRDPDPPAGAWWLLFPTLALAVAWAGQMSGVEMVNEALAHVADEDRSAMAAAGAGAASALPRITLQLTGVLLLFSGAGALIGVRGRPAALIAPLFLFPAGVAMASLGMVMMSEVALLQLGAYEGVAQPLNDVYGMAGTLSETRGRYTLVATVASSLALLLPAAAALRARAELHALKVIAACGLAATLALLVFASRSTHADSIALAEDLALEDSAQ